MTVFFLDSKSGGGADLQVIKIIPEAKQRRQANSASGAAENKQHKSLGLGGVRKSSIGFIPANVPKSYGARSACPISYPNITRMLALLCMCYVSDKRSEITVCLNQRCLYGSARYPDLLRLDYA
jgi:hypothetical protein